VGYSPTNPECQQYRYTLQPCSIRQTNRWHPAEQPAYRHRYHSPVHIARIAALWTGKSAYRFMHDCSRWLDPGLSHALDSCLRLGTPASLAAMAPAALSGTYVDFRRATSKHPSLCTLDAPLQC